MKLRLPNKLIAALMSAMSAAVFTTLASVSAAYGEVTYTDLTRAFIDVENGVYYDGHGTFEVSSGNSTTLGITINVNELEAYQGSNDYTGLTPFVAWTFSTGLTDGIADVSTKNNKASYAGLTGYWGTNGQWSLGGGGQTALTLETLKSQADANGLVSMTVSNTLTSGVSLTLGGVTYQNTSLRFTGATNDAATTTAYTISRNYVTSVTLNTASTLDVSGRELPPDFSGAFHSDRWDAEDKTSLGRVLFVGDSITHGIADQTWRWQIFKTFVDNGIENEIAGPLSGYDSKYVAGNATSDRAMTSYAGVEFTNDHLAQSSGRTHNIISGSNAGTSGVNYSQWSTAKTAEYYNADTIICMMGTNDILSDGGTYIDKFGKLLGGTVSYDEATNHYTWTHTGEAGNWGEWGTMGTIAKDLIKQDSDTLYVMSVPTWANRTDLNYGANIADKWGKVDNVQLGSQETAHYGVREYNVMLEQWTESYSAATGKNVKYVDVNRGLVDLTDSVSFRGYTGFFRPGTTSDQLHPLEQGSLIIAGNLAQGMGLAGRTAGLTRSAAGHADHGWQNAASSITIANSQTVEAVTGNPFSAEGGYTIDFRATFGNGSANGWLDKANALSISLGDGSNTGTLKLSEGYIMWGDTVIFCQDNHLTDNDALRVAYTQGNAEQNIGSGYYVWLGDMLIGQALTAGTGTLNGVTLSSAGGMGTVKGLTYTNTAYAPSTNLITSFDNGGAAAMPMMPSSERDKVVSPTTFEGLTSTQLAAAGSVYTGAVSSNRTEDANILVVSNQNESANLFGGLNAVMQKNNEEEGTTSLSMVIGNDVTVGGQTYSSLTVAFAGSYNSIISGTLAVELNNATMNGDILMGVISNKNRGTIGAAELTVNSGATVNGNIYGGSQVANGTISGDSVITINGGYISGNVEGGGNVQGSIIGGNAAVTINGGVIDGNISVGGGTISGEKSITVVGNKALIGGNITADNGGTVTLKDVATSGYSDGFDKYEGTITATNLVLDNYTAGLVNATLVTDYVTAKNGTVATIHGLKLRNCSIDATGAEAFTLGESVISGNTISYSGNIRLEDGTSFTITTPTTVQTGEEGFSDGKFIYQLQADATGSLLAADGSALTAAHTATFTGTDGLEGLTFTYESYRGSLVAHAADAAYTITTSTVNYSDISSASAITMSGGQLNLDTALTRGTITATGGTVNIAEDVTLAQSQLAGNGPVKLVGDGTFDLNSMVIAKPANINISDAEAWHGTIRVNGSLTSGSGQLEGNLNNLANANSKVELHGLSGWLGGNVNAALVLTGLESDGTGTALKIVNGISNNTRWFTKSVEGAGDIEFAWVGTTDQGTRFTGDISGWTGSFKTTGNSTKGTDLGGLQLRFTDAATTINANVMHDRDRVLDIYYTNANAVTVNGTVAKGSKAGSVLNLHAESNVTFNNSISADTLSAAERTITLGSNGEGDSTTHGTLTIGGTAAIGTLAMQDGTHATFNGNTTIGEVTVAASASATLSGSGTLNQADGKAGPITLSGGGKLTLDSAVTYEGTTTVKAGELVFAGGSADIGRIIMSGGANETVQFSKKEGAANAYSFTTMSLAEGNNGTKWLIVDDGVTVHATGHDIGNHGNASINTGWNVQNGGLNINGVLNAEGTISLDGPGTAYIQGAGTITTTGLNISNGRTVNVGGGLTIDITSDTGIYKRAGGDSTLNLADVTLQANSVDWELKNNVNNVHLTNATTGTTFEAASGRTITVSKALSGAGSFNKAGAGTVILNEATTYTGLTTVSKGTLRINNRDANNNRVHALGDVVLGQDANLQSYFATYDGSHFNTYATTLGTVSLAEGATSAKVSTTHFGGLTTIAGLEGTGTLILENAAYSTVNNTFSIGGSATTAAQTAFHGTLDVQQTNTTGDKRGTMIVFNDEYSAADAELTMSATANKQVLGIGLNSGTVKLKGINDNANIAAALAAEAQYEIFSGSGNNLAVTFDGNAGYFNNAADGTVRTLELTGSGSYSTAAKVGANINLTMSGSGTQTFSGDLNAMNGIIRAQSGHLVLANGATTPDTINLHAIHVGNGTVELSGGSYTVNANDNTHGVFGNDGAATTGYLLLSNGADLTLGTPYAWWQFQVNAGENSGVYIKGAADEASRLNVTLHDGGEVTIKALDTESETGAHIMLNNGSAAKNFAVDQDYITVKDADYTVNYGATNKSVHNKLQNTALTNSGTGTLTATNSTNTLVSVHAENGAIKVEQAYSSADSLKSIKATGADVTLDGLRQLTSVSVNELIIGEGKTVRATHTAADTRTNDTNLPDAAVFANIEVTGTQDEHGTINVAIGGATQGINLTVNTQANAVDYSAIPGNVLNLNGGSLTLNTIGNNRILLSDSMMAQLDNHMMIEVMSGIGLLTINNYDYAPGAQGTDGVVVVGSAASVFGSQSGLTFANDAQVLFRTDGDTGTLLVTPEPATTALSLLALAGLAARRRRH